MGISLSAGALMRTYGTNLIKHMPVNGRFCFRRTYATNQESEISKLAELIKEQNSKLDDLNSRIKKIEIDFSNSTKLSQRSITSKKQVAPITPRYIRIKGKSFNIHKISRAYYRHSLIWWTYPFVVEIRYQRRNTDFLIGGEHFKVPVTSDYETHEFQCKDETSANTLVNEIKKECPHLIKSK